LQNSEGDSRKTVIHGILHTQDCRKNKRTSLWRDL
jgi:hypothetical protein